MCKKSTADGIKANLCLFVLPLGRLNLMGASRTQRIKNAEGFTTIVTAFEKAFMGLFVFTIYLIISLLMLLVSSFPIVVKSPCFPDFRS